MKLKDIARYVTDKVGSDAIDLESYVTTDSILQNKAGRVEASNLPPAPCTLTRFQKGDILIANIRPYLRKIWSADIDGGCNADVLVFRAINGYSSAFVYAVLMQDSFYTYAMKGAKGSKMPRGDKEQIMRFEVPSNLQDTDGIGNLIVAIKAKIDLLNQINRNLEAMARQFYDYWFVQFDFPDRDGKPYKSSGGKMVWNDKLKCEIPIEWVECKLSDIANITMGQSPEGTSYNEVGNGILFYQGSTDFGDRFPSVRQYTTAPTRFADKGDILMSVRAPVGALNIANNHCCIGRGLSALSSKIGSQTHLYYVMDGLRMAFEQRNDSGTTFGSITKEDLHNLPTIKPQMEVLKKFGAICSPIFDVQMNIGAEIDKLTAQRDELLPLLMNGQVSVRLTAVNCDLSHD